MATSSPGANGCVAPEAALLAPATASTVCRPWNGIDIRVVQPSPLNVITTVFGTFAEGNHASGGKVTEHMKADPQSVGMGLGAIADSLAQFAVACIEAGASGIYYSAQGGEEDRFLL